MPTLFYHPGNASMSPHILLEEIGVPYELALVDRKSGAHKSPEYLKLNPNGLIPVLRDGDLVLWEAAAICLHLADTHRASGLMPDVGTAERAHAYKWLAWLSTTLQPTLMLVFYPDRFVAGGDAAAAAQVKTRAQARAGELLDLLDAQVASSGGPWLLGETYRVVDPYAMMLCRWTRGFSRPARALPNLGPYLERVLARPAVIRALTHEDLPKPWV
jgi:glutathione S-transferase